MNFCERRVGKKTDFDRRSFRWITRGRTKLLIGCPRGKWKPRAQRCAIGTKAYAILTPTRGRCPRGKKHITKG
jgi:hypothetical protein